MKRLVCFTLITCLIVTLVGCTSTHVSNQHLNYGKKAIEIVDQYLDFEISIEEAYAKIEELVDRRDELPDTDYDDPTYFNNFWIEEYTFSISMNLFQLAYEIGSETEQMEYLLANRNEIAEYIGVQKR